MHKTIKESMEILGVKRSTLYKLLKDHNVSTYKKPGQRQTFILEEDLTRINTLKRRKT